MFDTEFNVGDVVELKCGGCHMVITGMSKDDTNDVFALCIWQTTDFQTLSREIDVKVLTKIK